MLNRWRRTITPVQAGEIFSRFSGPRSTRQAESLAGVLRFLIPKTKLFSSVAHGGKTATNRGGKIARKRGLQSLEGKAFSKTSYTPLLEFPLCSADAERAFPGAVGSSLADAVLFRGLGSGRKYVPCGDKHRRDHRADHKTIETEDRDAPERGDQHDVIR